jgi:hypothetical protein
VDVAQLEAVLRQSSDNGGETQGENYHGFQWRYLRRGAPQDDAANDREQGVASPFSL